LRALPLVALLVLAAGCGGGSTWSSFFSFALAFRRDTRSTGFGSSISFAAA
jgi:hypothetical protein